MFNIYFKIFYIILKRISDPTPYLLKYFNVFIHLLNLHKKATLFPYSLPAWTRLREKLRSRGDCLSIALWEMRPIAISSSEVETAGNPAGGGRNAECLALRRGLCRLNYSDHQTSTAGQRGKPAAEAPINSLVSPCLFCWQNTLVLSPSMAQH